MLDAYLSHLVASNGQESAERTRDRYLARFESFRAGREITPALLSDYRTSLAQASERKGRPLDGDLTAPSTRNRHLGAIAAYLCWCCDRGDLKLECGAIRRMLKSYKEPKPLPRVLTPEETKALLKAAVALPYDQGKCPAAAIVALGLTLGTRPSELMGIRRKDVDLSRKEVRVYASKTDRERRVPFHDSLTAGRILGAMLEHRTELQRLLAPDNTEIEISTERWARICKGASLDVTPKVMRSTASAYAASSGKVSEYLLSARFGHTRDVADRFYRLPIYGITGATFEEWYGCVAEFEAAAAHVIDVAR